MDTIIDQQVAMDEALVPHAKRLRIERSNFCLLSDIKSKESTPQLVYDVLRLCPFFKAFLVTADVPEIYMQEFWAIATVHHYVILFKMDNKKHIVNLESFKDMLHICPMVHGQYFVEPPFKEEILAFIRFLGHSATITTLTDVNINKLYQPWRSFAVKHKDHKKSNEMYYPRFTKVIIHHFISKDLSIPKRNKFGALLPIELTNKEIRNSNAYKEYYAVATGAAPPKPKASTYISQASGSGADEGTGSIPGIPDVPTNESEEELSWNSTEDEGDDRGKDGDGDDDDNGDDGVEGDGDDDDEDDDGEEGDDDDDDDQEVEKDDEEGGGDDEQAYDEEEYDEETNDEESFDPLYRDVNINQRRGIQATIEVKDSHMTLTPVNPDGQQQSSSMSLQFVTSMLNPTLDVVSAIPGIIQQYMNQRMNEAVKVAVQIQSNRLRDEAQRENDEFLKIVDENMQKIIKEQVKEQVKVQVSKILPRIEQTVNEKLETEVLTRSSHSSNTSYAVAADLSEMELKKILIEKMEGNKSIQRPDEQRNLYKALVEAYESDKIILDTYGETVTLKRRRDDDADKDEESSAGPDRGSKRRREGNEPESASAPMKTVIKSAGRSTQWSQSRQASASESATAEEPMQTTFQMEEPPHPEFDTELEYHLEEVFKATTDQLDWVNPKGQQYPHNLLKPLPLIPNNRGRHVIPFKHFINNNLEYLRGGASSRKYTTSITKTKAADYGHIKWIEYLVHRTMWIEEPIGYDKHALWGKNLAVTELKIVEWHNYKHLDWITVRRDDDKLYKFKEGDFKGLRIQDIEDMLLLLVQGKLTNLTVEERFAFNVSLRMFTRSIMIQRRVEDLQLGVESYQKKLNLTKSDSYRSDLKSKEAYTAYSNPRGFIY
uniref:Uncharacterized protein n=1 Tax=Tanacetum cinerariifolium TaxID=118510 RepID=A0A6L2LK09_TANCI|nr:hypothetical protein [Tanacetum cinerariifolium]